MLNSIDINQICQTSILITVGIIGITQLLKNFFAYKKGNVFSIISIVLTAILCLLNSSLVPSIVTILTDTFILALAVSQLAWDILAKAIPTAVQSFIDKIINQNKEIK